MATGFGFSASDIIVAAKVVCKVGYAFKHAKDDYASTEKFLKAFEQTLKQTAPYIDTSGFSDENVTWSKDLSSQMGVIYGEYEKFDGYLRRHARALSSDNFHLTAFYLISSRCACL